MHFPKRRHIIKKEIASRMIKSPIVNICILYDFPNYAHRPKYETLLSWKMKYSDICWEPPLLRILSHLPAHEHPSWTDDLPREKVPHLYCDWLPQGQLSEGYVLSCPPSPLLEKQHRDAQCHLWGRDRKHCHLQMGLERFTEWSSETLQRKPLGDSETSVSAEAQPFSEGEGSWGEKGEGRGAEIMKYLFSSEHTNIS